MSREAVREDIDTLFPNQALTFASRVTGRTEKFPVRRPNYTPRTGKEQFIVIGIDYGKPAQMYGGVIERGSVIVAVMVPFGMGGGYALEVCAELDRIMPRGTIHETATQLQASEVNTIGRLDVGDNTSFFRVDWSAPYMRGST